jgi:hypothetical protein
VPLVQYVIAFAIVRPNQEFERGEVVRPAGPPRFAMLLIKAILTKHLGARRTWVRAGIGGGLSFASKPGRYAPNASHLTEIPRAGGDDRPRLGLPVRILSSLARRNNVDFWNPVATAFVRSISCPKGDFANKSFRTPVEVRFTF